MHLARRFAFAVLASAALLALPGIADAHLYNGTLSVKTYDLVLNPHSQGGVSIACPSADRILDGGGFWHMPGGNQVVDSGPVIDSSPVSAGGTAVRWVADAYNRTNSVSDFKVVLLCLPSTAFGSAYTLITKDVPFSAAGSAGGYLKCPTGTKVATGGAYLHAAYPPGPFAYVRASTPTLDGNGWYAYGTADGPITLTIAAVCLSPTVIGTVSFHTSNKVPNGQQLLVTVKCSSGQRIVTGGVFWHKVGNPALDSTVAGEIDGGYALPSGRGWRAMVYNDLSYADAEVVAICVKLP